MFLIVPFTFIISTLVRLIPTDLTVRWRLRRHHSIIRVRWGRQRRYGWSLRVVYRTGHVYFHVSLRVVAYEPLLGTTL